MWTTLLCSGVAALFVAKTIASLCELRWMRQLPSIDVLARTARPSPAAPKPVRCSIVIAARDEEARIEETIRHLLEQRGVDLELIVVDDRSCDGTGDILRRAAKSDDRVTVIRVDTLPDGWLGKCHACHVGANAATCDWLLFTDADCWLKPDVIARAVQLAERDGADHVTLSPGVDVVSPGARAWHLLFLTTLLSWFAGVNRDRPRAYLGLGAFNLVRNASYRRSGGYEALRLTVLDDVKLGLLLRRAGARTRAFLGVDDVRCHWGTTVGSMVRIMEKNYFAALDYNLWVVCLAGLAALVAFSIIVAGLVMGTALGLVAAFSPLTLILPAGVLARRLGWSWPCAVCMPFLFPVLIYAILKSAWVTLRNGGVTWRQTFYPLHTLRRGSVR